MTDAEALTQIARTLADLRDLASDLAGLAGVFIFLWLGRATYRSLRVLWVARGWL